MSSSKRLQIGVFVAAVFLYWMSLYLYVPTLPLYAQSKSDNLAMVGVVISMYGLWQALVRLPLGIMADWLGRRRPFIFAGILLAGLGALVMGWAGGAPALVVGRSVTGLAAAAWVPMVAVFSTFFPPAEAVRASALLTLAGSLGRLLATGANGALNSWEGYGLAFYVAAGAALLAFLVLLPAHETRRPPQRPSFAGIGRLIARRDVLLPSLLGAVSQYANYAITFGFLPVLAKQLGASDIVQSLLITLTIGVVTLGNLLATTLVKRIGSRRLVYLSFILLSAGIGVAALARSLPWFFLAQICVGISQGVGYPLLMGLSIQDVEDAERTTAMGVHQAVYAIGMFAGPWLSGMLADGLGLRPMFWITAAGCLALGLLGTRALPAQKRGA